MCFLCDFLCDFLCVCLWSRLKGDDFRTWALSFLDNLQRTPRFGIASLCLTAPMRAGTECCQGVCRLPGSSSAAGAPARPPAGARTVEMYKARRVPCSPERHDAQAVHDAERTRTFHNWVVASRHCLPDCPGVRANHTRLHPAPCVHREWQPAPSVCLWMSRFGRSLGCRRRPGSPQGSLPS